MTKTSHLPVHVGIIMDGNRRWAREKGLPIVEGHRRGYNQAITIADHAFQRGITYLTLYAFSTENWNRTPYEVSYLMELLLAMFEKQALDLHKRHIRVMVIGTRKKLSKRIIKAIDNVHRLTMHNTAGTLLIAFNYGGRTDIVDAMNAFIDETKGKSTVTENAIQRHLSTHGIPDPDFIIRTSGEQRLSGFLLWQSAYSELYFTKKYWPAFTPGEFDKALDEYASRQRRYGV